MSDEVVLFESFPKQDEFLNAIFSGKYSFILYGGAVRGGKTFAGLGAFILLCLAFPGSRWAVVRKNLSDIKRTTYTAWDKIKPSNIIVSHNHDTHTVTFSNDSQIVFFAESYTTDKDLNRWKGLEVNGFLLEEMNEIQEVSFDKAIERAGSYVIPKTAKNLNPKQPDPIIIGTCNPSFGWVKDKFYDPWKEGTLRPIWLYIPSRIFDNPYISKAYLETLKSLPRWNYEVFVNGNWDIQLKTGGEFWKQFELDQHVGIYPWDIENSLHLSVDNNVYPYISITIWQINKNELDSWDIYQVAEICAKDPSNTASAAGRMVSRWLNKIGYQQKIYIYGDPTTKARNTIDDDKKSFLDKFVYQIERTHKIQKRMFAKSPSVAMTGDFINEIYESEIFGLRIRIDENCKESIGDYIDTKEEKDGTIKKLRIKNPKTEVTYEKNGHMTDTKRYFIVKLFYAEFCKFQKKLSDPAQYHIAQPNARIRGGI